ncbi:hypothetical protein CLOSTMETH_00749 [[Clostridium] methylpentosum DSM 5476]|uniref:Uncharacterized protein n=1 Tax=[Clostridium] methylpentosum DSM 5476 TaxID=537013 RepID=C0EA95_9FIRM|nr:hypothetical protein CLOSTMETH_00749 [[Clostridium] methylpentosum DSM 5476]
MNSQTSCLTGRNECVILNLLYKISRFLNLILYTVNMLGIPARKGKGERMQRRFL